MNHKMKKRGRETAQGEILAQTKQSGLPLYFVYRKARFVNGWGKRSPADKMKKLPAE